MHERVHKLGRGAWLIRLPLPWKRLPTVNAFLFRQSDGWLLLDCGLNTDETFAAFDEAFAQIGLGWTAVRRILVSHMHPDHVGGAARARRLSGAPVWMQPDEARWVSPRNPAEAFFAATEKYLLSHGVPSDAVEQMKQEARSTAESMERFLPDETLDEGDAFDYEGGRLEAVSAPGHSLALLCFLDSANRTLYSTDAILEKITPNIGVHPFSSANPLGEYFDSLAKLETLDVDRVAPSHGDPFGGHRDWIVSTRRHHRERCDQLAQLAAGPPRPAFDIAREHWGPNRSAGQLRFAMAEALAHLEFLARTGRAAKSEVDGVIRWQAI
jgi:glyoxylase-like metal-dependent hydrolase (beta-lactamase superfamily II)